MKYLFQILAGVGNQIQCFPALWRAWEAYGFKNVDVAYVSIMKEDGKAKTEFYKILCDSFGSRLRYAEGTMPKWWEKYDGLICPTPLAYPRANLDIIAFNADPHIGNEVDFKNRIIDYEDAKRIMTEVLPLKWKSIRGKKFTKRLPKFDLVVCNGSTNSIHWIRKRYQRWNEVIEKFPKKKIACVGNPDEYIEGCVNMTHLSLAETFDLVSKCKVFSGNDSGLYHFANAIGIPNVVVFTATNTVKNYNKTFHRFAKLIKPTPAECPKHPCQHEWRLSDDWGTCTDWKCTHFNPTRIIKAIKEKLK